MKSLVKILILCFILAQTAYAGRYYNSDVGRFIQRDPLGYVDGMSLYNAYFAEQFGTDPMGTEWISDDGGKNYYNTTVDTLQNLATKMDVPMKSLKRKLHKFHYLNVLGKGPTKIEDVKPNDKLCPQQLHMVEKSASCTWQVASFTVEGKVGFFGAAGAESGLVIANKFPSTDYCIGIAFIGQFGGGLGLYGGKSITYGVTQLPCDTSLIPGTTSEAKGMDATLAMGGGGSLDIATGTTDPDFSGMISKGGGLGYGAMVVYKSIFIKWIYCNK